MKDKKLLTKSEFQVMRILWNLPGQSGYTSEILARYENPKPAYTTLATFLKILENKGFVTHKKEGSKLFFTPLVTLEDYAETSLAHVPDTFFHGSFAKLAEFFLRDKQLTQEEAQAAIDIIRQHSDNPQ